MTFSPQGIGQGAATLMNVQGRVPVMQVDITAKDLLHAVLDEGRAVTFTLKIGVQGLHVSALT